MHFRADFFSFLCNAHCWNPEKYFQNFIPGAISSFTPSVSLLSSFHQAESSCTRYGIKGLKPLCPINLTMITGLMHPKC